MIDRITNKFGIELKPTKASWKSQLYNLDLHSLLTIPSLPKHLYSRTQSFHLKINQEPKLPTCTWHGFLLQQNL